VQFVVDLRAQADLGEVVNVVHTAGCRRCRRSRRRSYPSTLSAWALVLEVFGWLIAPGDAGQAYRAPIA